MIKKISLAFGGVALWFFAWVVLPLLVVGFYVGSTIY